MSNVIEDGVTRQTNLRQDKNTEIIPFNSSKSNINRKTLFSKKISQRSIINTLNHIHFLEKTIFASMVFSATGEEFLVSLRPEPCTGSILTCRLPKSDAYDFTEFKFNALILDDGQNIIHIPGTATRISKEKITLRISEKGFVLNTRQAKRFHSGFIEVVLKKGDISVSGRLEDFSPSGLKVRVTDNFDAMNAIPDRELIQVQLTREGRAIYTGFGSIKRVSENESTCVIEPSKQPLTSYARRHLRNPRLNISPAPRMEIFHPIVGRTVSYDIVDITTSGFSLEEMSDRLLFLPGMVFAEVRLVFAGEFSIQFSARTVHVNKQRGGVSKLGFLITDIDLVNYRRLFNILTRSYDPQSLAQGRISADALWQFFFRTGFIYPEKYRCIASNKDHYLKIYDKLYNQCPELFASITYEQNEELYGHVSLFRAYPRTWFVQHLAAIPMGTKRTGLYVLNNVLNFLDGAHRMPSLGMKYLVFNYRPENRFPNFFFGGVCRKLDAPHMCSVDTSAYIQHTLPPEIEELPAGWDIVPCTKDDISSLHDAYRRHSVGLLIDSFCFGMDDDPLWETYRKYGLTRSCKPYVLKKDGDCRAFFVLERADRGVNLSDLLNSIRIFVPTVDRKIMPWTILQNAISILGREYHAPMVILQIFPVDYCTVCGIEYKKRYTTWIARTSYFDPHFDAIKRMTKFSMIKYAKSLIEDMLGLNRN